MNSSDESPAVIELPDDAIEAAKVAVICAARAAYLPLDQAAAIAVAAAEPFIAARVRAEALADERVAIVAELEAAGHLAAMNLIAVCDGPTFDERIAEAVAAERQRIKVALAGNQALYDNLASNGILIDPGADAIDSAAFPVATPTEPASDRYETRIEYGHQTDQFGWVPEYRGIKYATHQREVAFRNGPPLLLDHWSDPDGKRKPFGPQPEAPPVPAVQPPRWCEHGVLPADACDLCSRTIDAVPAVQPPTFEQLLADPLEQFDTRSELLPVILRYLTDHPRDDVANALKRSIEEYRNAPPATASTSHMTRPAEQPEER